jgi:hypothetical protein
VGENHLRRFKGVGDLRSSAAASDGPSMGMILFAWDSANFRFLEGSKPLQNNK